jgi:hypothetical protein
LLTIFSALTLIPTAAAKKQKQPKTFGQFSASNLLEDWFHMNIHIDEKTYGYVRTYEDTNGDGKLSESDYIWIHWQCDNYKKPYTKYHVESDRYVDDPTHPNYGGWEFEFKRQHSSSRDPL